MVAIFVLRCGWVVTYVETVPRNVGTCEIVSWRAEKKSIGNPGIQKISKFNIYSVFRFRIIVKGITIEGLLPPLLVAAPMPEG